MLLHKHEFPTQASRSESSHWGPYLGLWSPLQLNTVPYLALPPSLPRPPSPLGLEFPAVG